MAAAEGRESTGTEERLGVARDQWEHPEAVREAHATPQNVGDPVVQLVTLDGGYAAAVISQAQDPNAPNIAEIVKVRTVTAVDVAVLQPRIVACLISEYGLSQAEAESVPITGAAHELAGDVRARVAERVEERRAGPPEPKLEERPRQQAEAPRQQQTQHASPRPASKA